MELHDNNIVILNALAEWADAHPAAAHDAVLITATLAAALFVFAVIKLITSLISSRRAKAKHEHLLDAVADAMEKSETEKRSSTKIAKVDEYWTCDHCGQEFRILSNVTPSYCPNCGKPVNIVNLDEINDEEPAFFVCPECKSEFEMLDGSDPDRCPECGFKYKRKSNDKGGDEDVLEDLLKPRDSKHAA